MAAEFSRRVEREPTIETVREFRSDLEGTIAAATTKPYELPADVMTVVGSFLSGQKGTLAMQSKKLKYTPWNLIKNFIEIIICMSHVSSKAISGTRVSS